jgi:hypothetical protein
MRPRLTRTFGKLGGLLEEDSPVIRFVPNAQHIHVMGVISDSKLHTVESRPRDGQCIRGEITGDCTI